MFTGGPSMTRAMDYVEAMIQCLWSHMSHLSSDHRISSQGTQARNCSLDSFVYHPSAIGSSGPSISKLSALKYSPLPVQHPLVSQSWPRELNLAWFCRISTRSIKLFFSFVGFPITFYYSHMLRFLPTVLWAKICAKCCPFKKADALRIHISHQHCSYFTFRMPETAEKIPGQIIWKRGWMFSPLGFHQTSRNQWFTIGNWTFWVRIWRVEGAKNNFPTSKFCWSWGEECNE